MKVLVDTSVWSLVLRSAKKSNKIDSIRQELEKLINNSQAILIGPIRQEVLSGIKHLNQFELLREKLRDFDDLVTDSSDYEVAAEFYNRCRQKGVQGSHIDFLIAAVSANHDISIFTLDKDFTKYAKYCNIHLYQIKTP